jgi:hypothetical protein
MAGSQSPQDDFGQHGDTATPGGAPEQRPKPQGGQQHSGEQPGGQWQYQQPGGQPHYQQVQPYALQQPAARQYATGLTSAQQVWYTLQCIYFGMGYLAKIPAKKALEDYGMAQLTSAELFWYTVLCIFFGAGYFAKISTAKALSEMPQFQTARYRR